MLTLVDAFSQNFPTRACVIELSVKGVNTCKRVNVSPRKLRKQLSLPSGAIKKRGLRDRAIFRIGVYHSAGMPR